jgi:hypothetical protein
MAVFTFDLIVSGVDLMRIVYGLNWRIALVYPYLHHPAIGVIAGSQDKEN